MAESARKEAIAAQYKLIEPLKGKDLNKLARYLGLKSTGIKVADLRQKLVAEAVEKNMSTSWIQEAMNEETVMAKMVEDIDKLLIAKTKAKESVMPKGTLSDTSQTHICDGKYNIIKPVAIDPCLSPPPCKAPTRMIEDSTSV